MVKWYTRYLEVVVPKGVEVRLLSRAPKQKTVIMTVFCFALYNKPNFVLRLTIVRSGQVPGVTVLCTRTE